MRKAAAKKSTEQPGGKASPAPASMGRRRKKVVDKQRGCEWDRLRASSSRARFEALLCSPGLGPQRLESKGFQAGGWPGLAALG